LAFWLFASPRLFGYSDAPVTAWNAYVIAAVVAVLSIAAMAKFAPLEEWINALVGLGLTVSPWLVGYTEIAAATWNHVIVGVLIVALSFWELAATPSGISIST
jgi:hypothetical protein